jgi:hypothetical protein
MRCFSLSGNEVNEGIKVSNGRILFSDFGNEQLVAVGLDVSQHLYMACAVGRDANDTVVLRPFPLCEVTDTSRCLVLVHEYHPGVGAKRWPSFHIDWENAGEVTKLSEAARTKGSGSDGWTLILAPIGWPQNIAGQFIDKRDYSDQVIGYKTANSAKPDFALAEAFKKSGLF